MYLDPVYLDPLLPTTSKVFVPFVKHFGYTYQDEHRFCWLPNTTTPSANAVDIEIGSLKDFSDLIVL